MSSKLTLECLAIGSLPHDNLDSAMELVQKTFHTIPFWPQMAKLQKNEDMIIQFLENMPSFFIDKNYLDTEDEKFYEDIEQFFEDYENIIQNASNTTTSKILDKYKISEEYSKTFPKFIQILKNAKPSYAKGQVTGPFTLATTLVDKNGKCAIYDDTLKEIIIKTLTLKALWQIEKIKETGATPIIFIDEPSISQLGTSAYITISSDEVIGMIKEISDVIQANGGLSAIHCCGKCDWSIPILAGVNIINLDAYSYAKHLSLFENYITPFLENGNKIAWGIVPTLDTEALEKADLNKMIEVFDKAVKYLTNKGIDEKIIIENSLITPSCGAGGLSIELAEKAMNLTSNLSKSLKERYSI